MLDRHGIERLRWLLENDPHVLKGHVYGQGQEVPRHAVMTNAQVQIEVASAVIEELHDFLLELRHPMAIIHSPTEPIPSG